ncbi:hypothetical protein JAAARDRAFT_190081 [Jaapia argillacea MUCL 33604]|uniref:Cation/H+ exchanger transmembrane domain-containing protein n=1 Tax=Jaapia argillacea MUCL 33604 TaxID=933084 RepID=A0A067QH04_9AGAM|nr:hypothetical protein JAAARDRAFT_190081 [Jaapia argillacea MUCL 33604]
MPSEFSSTILDIARTLVMKRTAPDQGGLLTGKDPTAFNTADPLRIWIIQVGVIVLTTQLLSLLLGRIRQPKVIAEVIGGILLGPTAFGRIPGFTEHIFPTDSRPYLSLVANIGLCLFLFLVGLEIDASIIRRNARLSATVAFAGMCLPFGLGAGLAVPLYHQFIDPSVKFTNFMLFTGVAYSITAFPVLCRILTELKLLDTTVGIVVLSAGVGNDIIGWTLLALSVALANAASGLTALWILMVCVGWALFLLFGVKRVLYILARRTGSIENGPSMFFMTVVMLIVFGSAFFTDVIGVHAIFGAFLAGLIVPRDGGLAIALTEKLEDMVSIIFLPLYFTLSGLSTDLGLLNNGITWAYTIAICSLAYSGKFGGCTLAARYAGFSWRESSTIGTLMSCKGQLIVLNVGLSAGILSQRVFSMFVLEALLLTFMTTPVVTILYPPERRTRVSATGVLPPPHLSGDEGGSDEKERGRSRNDDEGGMGRKKRFAVVLDKIEHLPGIMALTQLIRPHDTHEGVIPQPPSVLSATTSQFESVSPASSIAGPPKVHQPVFIDALRLIELSDRTSAVMKGSVVDTLIHTDPLLGIYKMFGELNDLSVSASLSIVTYDDLAASVADHARRNDSQLILVPWLPPSSATYPPLQADTTAAPGGDTRAAPPTTNPFDALFKSSTYPEKAASATHSLFIRGVFSQSTTDVALFVDQGHAPGELRTTGSRHHLFLPFFGGPDDRLALEFVVQLCENPKIRATVVRVVKKEVEVEVEEGIGRPESAYLGDEKGGDIAAPSGGHGLTIHSINQMTHMTGIPDTVYGHATTQTRLQSETADNICWSRYASPSSSDPPNSAITSALSRIEFQELPTPAPLHAVTQRATAKLESLAEHRTRLLVVTGRSRRLAVENHHGELKQLMEERGSVGSEVRKTIGDVATGFVVSGCSAGLVVVQAANVSMD